MIWIKNPLALRKNTKFRKLVKALNKAVGVKVGDCVADGVLSLLWKSAYKKASDGVLTSYTPEEIAAFAGWKQDADALVNALVETGFIDREGDALKLHDWNEHTGKLVAQRKKRAVKLLELIRAGKVFQKAGAAAD